MMDASNPFLINRAILASRLSCPEVRLLLAIVDRAGHGRTACMASYAMLGRMIGRSRRHIIRLIRALAASGWIVIQPMLDPEGDRATNTIMLGPTLIQTIGAHLITEVGSDNLVTTWCQPCHQGGDKVVTRGGDKVVTQTSPINVSLNGHGRAPAPARAREENPEVTRVADLAAELMGDISWSLWVVRRAQLGDPPWGLEEVLRACVDAGKCDPRYAGGICRRRAAEGWKREVHPNGNGRVPYRSTPQPESPAPRPEDPGPRISAREAMQRMRLAAGGHREGE